MMAASFGTPCALLCACFLLHIYTVCGQTDQASFAANVFDRAGSMDPVDFDALVINRLGQLNQDTWRLTVPTEGLYLVSLSAGHPGDGNTHYKLQHGGSTKFAIYRDQSDDTAQCVMGKDVVTWLNKSEEIYVQSNGTRLISSTETLATSWGTFALSGEMRTTVGFGVGRSTNFTAGKITFETVWANDGNGWDSTDNVFKVPVTGIYYFSFSTGAESGNTVDTFLQVNGQKLHRLHRHPEVSVNVDSFQRAVMFSLFEGETVEVVADHDGYSNSDYLTSFSGFLYNNTRSIRLAWSVSRSTPLLGEENPLQFEQVDVNEGSAWQDNRAQCFFTGLYYLHVSAITSQNDPLLLTVLRNEVPVGSLVFETPSSFETLSRSMIVDCSQGDTLRISAIGHIYSADESRDINFLGFYMFA